MTHLPRFSSLFTTFILSALLALACANASAQAHMHGHGQKRTRVGFIGHRKLHCLMRPARLYAEKYVALEPADSCLPFI
jgi:hypothetical protein